MSTPSPYLRDRLLQAADGLRKDAETARLNVAAADQDVAAARALLQEAEAQAARARAEVDSISRGIAWLEREAAHLAPGPDPDPAEQLRATGLMREEPNPVDPAPPAPAGTRLQDNGLPMVWSDLCAPGGYVCAVLAPPDGPGIDLPDGTRVCGMPVESEPCKEHGPDSVPPAPRGLPLTPPVPHEPAGVPVATHGPLMTMPDTGLNPDPLPPAPPTAEPRHAKPADRPGLLARLTGGHRIVHDEQGDA